MRVCLHYFPYHRDSIQCLQLKGEAYFGSLSQKFQATFGTKEGRRACRGGKGLCHGGQEKRGGRGVAGKRYRPFQVVLPVTCF